jgi:hydrogenase nickel incorporation protein HypB
MCGTCGCDAAVDLERDQPAAAKAVRRTLALERKILDKNDALAARLRHRFAHAGVFVLNVMSSPGSGKTELLSRTLAELRTRYRCAAVTGDLATENDAARLSQSGVPSRQIVTGTLCHLEADLVEEAIGGWDLEALDLLVVENVGNLVCPGSFDLGEDLRVVLVATTEGEDKPLKYPGLVHSADIAVVTKMDVAEAVECDVERLASNMVEVNPGMPVLRLSAKRGQGMGAWLDLLSVRIDQKRDAAAQLSAVGARHSHA